MTDAAAPSSADRQTPGANDWHALGDVVALATEHLVAPVEGIHRAIAARWFGMAGERAAPVAKVYQAATAGVYGSVRLAGSLVGGVLGLGAGVVALRRPVRPLFQSNLGSGVQAAVNGLWGDALADRGSHFSIELGLRDADGRSIGTDAAALDASFPSATGRFAVLLHGLGETERCWVPKAPNETNAPDLAGVLAADGITPLTIRYNTGSRISVNGAALSTLLEEVVESWPVPVEQIVLIGNSMGGLVARSALHAAAEGGSAWLPMVRHLVTVGTPHLGAPLEKAAHVAAAALRLVPESRPIADFIDRRSVGIKDLRFGAIREEDWREAGGDELLRDVVGSIDVPETVSQHFIAGVVTTDPAHPVGLLVGDLMVRPASGTGKGRRRQVAATNVKVLGSTRHSGLATDPVIHAQIRAWLD